ncbi:hypothetical protein M9H77_27263 [Catharanthus roseus]|uniref:Uncharacterized protein n=1 Tax=Catharanthus roseus TaxID=4058 RepID=A0ACC0ADM2_CATRO|nr:hypothetical protein M9H77_27263 [Catharanthus roseus]
MPLLAVDNLGTKVLFVDTHPAHHFIDELTPIAILLPLTVRSSINQSMKDIGEGFEEGSKGEHNAERRSSSRSELEVVGMTLGTGLRQGKKRTRATLKGTSSSNISTKKARVVTPPSTPLKTKNAINKRFYSKIAELRMVELIDKPILAEKKITQEILEQYKVMELLLGMGCVELALFAEQYNENLVKEFYAISLRSLVHVRGDAIDFSLANIAHYLSCPHHRDIKGTALEEEVDFDEVAKVITSDAGAVWPETNRLNSNLIKMSYRACLESYVVTRPPGDTKTTVPSVVSPTPSTQGYTGPGKSTRQQSSTKVASPSPPPSPRIEVVLLFNGVKDLKGFKISLDFVSNFWKSKSSVIIKYLQEEIIGNDIELKWKKFSRKSK